MCKENELSTGTLGSQDSLVQVVTELSAACKAWVVACHRETDVEEVGILGVVGGGGECEPSLDNGACNDDDVDVPQMAKPVHELLRIHDDALLVLQLVDEDCTQKHARVGPLSDRLKTRARPI